MRAASSGENSMLSHAALGTRDPVDRPLDDLGLVHLELELAVDGAGGQEDVDPRIRGVGQRLGRTVDVFVIAPREPADRAAADAAGDLAHRLEVAR